MRQKTIWTMVLTAALMMGCTEKASAQESKAERWDGRVLGEHRNELQIGIGSMLASNVGDGIGRYDSFTPSFSIGYLRHTSRVWSFGVTLTTIGLTEKEGVYIYYPEKGDAETYWFMDKYRYFGLMGVAKARWARHRLWNFYSRAGVGPALSIHKGNADREIIGSFMFQASPLGFEIGDNRIRGFVELGFGMQGFISAGLAHRF